MKPLLILGLLPLLSACAASSVSTPSVEVPASLTVPCREAVALPERDLLAGEVERSWLQDRLSLRECRSRHQARVDAIQGGPQ